MTAWTDLTAGDFGLPGTQGALFPADSQGRVGGDLFEEEGDDDAADGT